MKVRLKNKTLSKFIKITAFIFVVFLLLTLFRLSQKNQHKFQNDQDSSAETLIISTFKDCPSNNSNSCALESALELLSKYPLEKIMQTIAKNSSDIKVFSICHTYPYTRALGFTAYQTQKDVGETLKKCDGSCYEACYHGVAEAAVIASKKSAIESRNPNKLSQICKTAEDYPSKNQFMACVHGIGTALFTLTQGQVPQSLEKCDLLIQKLDRQICYGGVFDKNNKSPIKNTDTKPDNSAYPCDTLSEKYRQTCYGFVARWTLEKNDFDIKTSLPFCSSIDSLYRQECTLQMAGDLVYFKLDEQKLKSACDLILDDSNLKIACLNRMASYLIQTGEPQRAHQFCAILEDQYQEKCYQTIS